MKVGVISDTHGVLNRHVLKALKGVQHILHAGDIDAPDVLAVLARIAPVTAVRGNMDHGHWAQQLPIADLVNFNGVNIYILHSLAALDLDPVAAGIQVIISGHTHQAEMKTDKGVLFFNPGSASYARYDGGLSVGRLEINADGVYPRIIRFDD